MSYYDNSHPHLFVVVLSYKNISQNLVLRMLRQETNEPQLLLTSQVNRDVINIWEQLGDYAS